ncbi:MAG TPA: DUF4091 domain-containing protein [Cyclobacteriaceae bacterium]|nr:DUF4091 domain-containing protein [Cyclobacteriaceae bacterium]
MRSRTELSISLIVILLSACGVSEQEQLFTLAAVSDLDRVFEDGYKLPPADDTLKIFGIRGETISGQFYIHSGGKKLEAVQADADILKTEDGNAIIPAENIAWYFVGSIPLTENAPNQPADVLTRTAPARFPDYLSEENQAYIDENMYRAVYITIVIPEDAVAGNYYGMIKVSSGGIEKFLPLSLVVYPLTLPEVRHLKVAEWYNTSHFDRHHGINEEYSDAWFEILRTYAENMAAHRQNVFEVPAGAILVLRSGTGKLTFDFTRFDQIAQVFWDTKGMDFLETGELTRFGDSAWFSTDIVFRDFKVENPETGEEITMPGKEVIPYLLPALEKHLREKGWLGKTLFHVKDEPTLRNVRSWKEASSLIHRYAPGLKRFDAIETTFLFDEIEVAIPKLDHLAAWYETYETAAREGTELWFYTVGIYQAPRYPNKTIDMPLIDNRIMHWLNYRYDLTGFLHWGWNQWTEKPFEETGMHIGDGWHVYPKKDGVLNSLRWEQMRNGLQDYEYFLMLETEVSELKDTLGKDFSWIDPKQRSKEIVGGVVKDFLDRSGNPDALYNAKREVIDEILNFKVSPRVYVQTNPHMNGTSVKEESYLLEVFGWAESGTDITVNGEIVTPDRQGMFLWNLSLSETKNQVIIEAKNSRGQKRIVRSFKVDK